jgi:hypothetical protein
VLDFLSLGKSVMAFHIERLYACYPTDLLFKIISKNKKEAILSFY